MFFLLIFYFLTFIFFASLDYCNIKGETKEILQAIAFLLLVFAITFRYGVPDYEGYVEMFESVPGLFSTGSYDNIHGEIGYLYLNTIVKSFCVPYIVMFALVGTTAVFLTLKFHRKYTKYYLVALIIYFSHVFLLREMIQIRSGLAVAIVMFAIPFVYERKLVPVLVIVFFASLFHSVAVIFLVIYFLYPYLNSTKRQVIILLIGVLLGFIFNLPLLEKVLPMIGVPSAAVSYINDQRYNYSLGLLNPVLIKHWLVLLVIYKNRSFLESKIKYFDVFLLCYVLAAFWLSAFNEFAIFSARIAIVFSNVEHILIPSLLLLSKYKIIIFTLIILYSVFAFYSKWNDIKDWTFSFKYL